MEIIEEKVNREYIKAKKRVVEIKAFRSNLLAYCLIIPFLIVVNYMTYWEYKWFWFTAIGWGIGVAIHAYMTFGISSDWEERKIKEFMENDNTY